MRVYVAGPYTQGDTIINVRNAVEAGDQVARAGHVPFIPHLYHFWHYLLPGDYELWMRLGFEWLETCDVVLRLPGPSSGADREEAFAIEHGIPIFYDLSPLFWAHLAGEHHRPHVDDVYTDPARALESLIQHPGALMYHNEDDEYVVTWRQS